VSPQKPERPILNLEDIAQGKIKQSNNVAIKTPSRKPKKGNSGKQS
jgi:hypothetical protein